MEPETTVELVNPATLRAETEARAVPGLSPAQNIALQSLLMGRSIIDAALAAGVHRATVHDWLRKDFAFKAAMNRGRRDVHENFTHRLERLAIDAACCVGRAIDDNDVEAALEVLKRFAALAHRTIGSDDPEALQAETEARDRRRSHRAKLETMRQETAIAGQKHSRAVFQRMCQADADDREDDRRRKEQKRGL